MSPDWYIEEMERLESEGYENPSYEDIMESYIDRAERLADSIEEAGDE